MGKKREEWGEGTKRESEINIEDIKKDSMHGERKREREEKRENNRERG